jgi:hypothetical protein
MKRHLLVEDTDLYRSANLLIKEYGEEAKVYASMQADACFEVGDITGKATWLRVIAAIDELQYTSPSEGPKSVH